MHYSLEQFLTAQAPVYSTVINELREGNKQTHWMWFIFPQIAGLGLSAMSQRYAIHDLKHAAEYLDHSVLGERLLECTQFVLSNKDKTIHEIFGSPDDMKFHSSMTLFALLVQEPIFQRALEVYFAGKPDSLTLDKVGNLS